MLTLFLIGAAALILILYWYLYNKFHYWEKRNIPVVNIINPYLSTILTIFNRLSLIENIMKIYNVAADKSIYGVYSLNLPILMVKNPEMLRQIMIKDFDHFTDHIDAFLKEENDSFFGKNLFALKGKRWHAMRTTLSPAFTGTKMRFMFELMLDCGEQIVKYFEQKFDRIKSSSEIMEIELQDICTKFTNDVICTVAMGIKVDSLQNSENKFYKTGRYIQSVRFWRFMLVANFPRFAKLINLKVMPQWIYDLFRSTIKDAIETRERENIIRPDMIHILNEAKKGQLKMDNNVEKGEEFAVIDETEVARPSNDKLVLTDEDIVAQAFLFFIAGFGNVALTMCWAAYELALSPDVQAELFNEIKQTMDESNGKLTYDKLMKMKYLDLVVTETLRKWPAVSMTNRQVTKPYTLKTENGDVKLEKDMYIGVPIIGIQRDAKYYQNPDKFDPERFRDPSKIQPFTYMPFGNGPRICIGSRLALLEVKVFLVYMLSKFEFCVIGRTPIPPTLKTGSTLEPKDGFWLGLKRRNL